MARQNHYPVTGGVRLSAEDREKLTRLCASTQRPPGEVLRLLVRLAQPTDVPAVTCAPSSDHEPCHAPDAQMP